MFWFGRSDGTRLRGLSPQQRIMPYVMRGRAAGTVYVESQFDVTKTRKWLWAYNRASPAEACTFMHLLLFCTGRVLEQFPEVDRFIAGRQLYQRAVPTISMVVKESLDSGSAAYTVKLPIADLQESLPAYSRRIAGILSNAGKYQEVIQRELQLILRLPDPLIRLVFWLRDRLDDWNLLPQFLTRDDPLYTSLFISNLGSLGLPDTFHHLYEHGTCSMFGVIGALRKAPVTDWDGTTESRDILPIRWTMDERAADAFTFSRALKLLNERMEDPLRFLGDPESAARGDHPPPPDAVVQQSPADPQTGPEARSR